MKLNCLIDIAYMVLNGLQKVVQSYGCSHRPYVLDDAVSEG